MKTTILVTIVASISISACSSPGSREKTTGGYKYMESETREISLKVPDDLETPTRSNRYDLPTLKSTNTSQIVGDNLRISSPRLVLPLVTGSHVEEGVQSATVLFDQVDDSQSLDKTIWDKVLAYLDKKNIGVENFDRTNNVLVTDWVVSVSEVESSWYSFSSEYIEQAKKFKLTLVPAPHGRTASLTSEIIDYIDEKGTPALSGIDSIAKRNNEVEFLNFIIAEYDFGVRLEQTRRIAKIRDGFISDLGFNADGDSAIMISANYNDTWPRLLLVLRKMGFDVIDLDQSSGIMFVLYNGNSDGFWSGLFAKEELALKKDNYRIFVQRAGGKTSVTFKNEDSVALSAKEVTDFFPVFKEYMASDNLDI